MEGCHAKERPEEFATRCLGFQQEASREWAAHFHLTAGLWGRFRGEPVESFRSAVSLALTCCSCDHFAESAEATRRDVPSWILQRCGWISL